MSYDWWPTPAEVTDPLAALLPEGTAFVEPCAGDGALIRALEARGMVCVDAYDIEPRAGGIRRASALDHGSGMLHITNPPFKWDLLRPLLEHWKDVMVPVWLLLPWQITCNLYWAPFAAHTVQMVPVGRVKWIEGSPHTGTKDFGWFYLDFRRLKSFLAQRRPKSSEVAS